MASLRHAFRRCRGGVSWRSAWRSSFRDGAVGAVLEPPRVFPHARDGSRGFLATAPWRAGTDETRASEAWLPWVGSVTAKDVDRVLRRVNRRIETGIVAMPATARCLETTWDHPSGHDDDEARVAANATLVFLHGFSDEAEHWREFAELLVSGTPGGCDIVLPGAPVRPFVVGGVHRHVGAWFEPRLNHRSDVEWSAVAEPLSTANGNGSGLAGSKVWRCGGIEPAVRWVDGLLADLERRGARPGSVILAGFSQGAALALAAAAKKAAWRPALGGVLCLRGYLPRRADVTEEAFASSEPREGSRSAFWKDAEREQGKRTPPAVLLCQGGRDEVAPTSWARVAADEMRLARARLGAKSSMSSEDSRVELTVCEDRGHELGADDVWRARWWIRSRLERVRTIGA